MAYATQCDFLFAMVRQSHDAVPTPAPTRLNSPTQLLTAH